MFLFELFESLSGLLYAGILFTSTIQLEPKDSNTVELLRLNRAKWSLLNFITKGCIRKDIKILVVLTNKYGPPPKGLREECKKEQQKNVNFFSKRGGGQPQSLHF